MTDYDHRFFRAIAVGGIAGVVSMWLALTVGFYFLTDQTLATTAGYALLPAVFCGPFFGGLFTTAFAARDDDETETDGADVPTSSAVSEAEAA